MMDDQSLDLLGRLAAESEYMEGFEAMNEDGEPEIQSATQATETVPNPNQRKKSNVWKEFTPLGVEQDGKRRSRCKHCNKKMVTETSQGTSSMKRHLETCPSRPLALGNRVETVYNPKVDREMMSEIIIFHDMSFHFVEYEKVRARDRYLNPKCQHICRQTAGADVFRRFEVEKEKLKHVFSEFKGRVSLTADMWTARTSMKGYLCLTAHYVDDEWRLNNKILAFCDVKPPHTGEELANKVLGCLKEWGLEKKVFCLTLDNATSNNSMQKILKRRLLMINGSGLLCDGKFFHVRCCAHILNLIVQEGLELANSLLENIRESVKFVKASDSRIESFAACVDSEGIKGGAGLSLDVSTRWNSTYDMLARALMFRKAFTSLKECDSNYKTLPSEEEWNRGEKICAFLKPFSTITKYFSGVKYPTANAYFLQVWKIERYLRQYSRCRDIGVEEMAKKMQLKFAKYWDEYSLTLAMAAVLDPRLKRQMLKSAYSTWLSPFRNRLLPKNVQALLCTRNWLRGFAEFEGDIEDHFDDENKDATTVASSSGV